MANFFGHHFSHPQTNCPDLVVSSGQQSRCQKHSRISRTEYIIRVYSKNGKTRPLPGRVPTGTPTKTLYCPRREPSLHEQTEAIRNAEWARPNSWVALRSDNATFPLSEVQTHLFYPLRLPKRIDQIEEDKTVMQSWRNGEREACALLNSLAHHLNRDA